MIKIYIQVSVWSSSSAKKGRAATLFEIPVLSTSETPQTTYENDVGLLYFLFLFFGPFAFKTITKRRWLRKCLYVFPGWSTDHIVLAWDSSWIIFEEYLPWKEIKALSESFIKNLSVSLSWIVGNCWGFRWTFIYGVRPIF